MVLGHDQNLGSTSMYLLSTGDPIALHKISMYMKKQMMKILKRGKRGRGLWVGDK